MKEENWEKVYKEFDKKFNGLLAYYEVHTGETERENIKSFIRSHQSELEKAVREEERKKIVKWAKDFVKNDAYPDFIAIKAIQKFLTPPSEK